jgi:hypothetical protein
MTSYSEYIPKQQSAAGIVPFESAEEAWFWFINAQQARQDGARYSAGQGTVPRPCEPVDILRILDRLYRQRRLLRDHLMVLRYYGRRRMPPDSRRVREIRAHKIWSEALARLESALIGKGIVLPPRKIPLNDSFDLFMEAAE